MEPDSTTAYNWQREGDCSEGFDWSNATDPCSSSDEECYSDGDKCIDSKEVKEAIKSANLKYYVAKHLASRSNTKL